MGIVHICDDAGRDLPVGEIGTVFWERETLPFRYHNDPEKTAAAQHPDHPTWTTSGDIGYIDPERFLYLTDRAAFKIISGGVNRSEERRVGTECCSKCRYRCSRDT